MAMVKTRVKVCVRHNILFFRPFLNLDLMPIHGMEIA